MPTQDQVVWSNCNVFVDGEHQTFTRGALLPTAASPDEEAQRGLLRLGGALRVVEVVYTPEELAEQAQARAEATAEREAALDVDPELPLADQMPGTAEPGAPTLTTPGGTPVVLGSAEDAAAAASPPGRAKSGTAAKPAPDKGAASGSSASGKGKA